MSLKSVASRIGKGFSNNIAVNAKNMGKDTDVAKKVFGKMFEQVDYEDADGLFEKALGIKMTKPATIVGSTLMAGYVVGSGLMQENHKGKAGEVYGEGLANSVNHSSSPGVTNASKMIEQDPELEAKFAKENLSRTQSGVDPEIVFAMHQLRGGE